ncbi:MAG: 5-formyltetrahydrofolate cyclo-ligase [Proteobacteria bacterium]|nr:5-formyltetrahydrofolate cyclo-ligase [Pseudomonadota bacterium]MBU1715804.1 5-formyltetrahydrofolate cyclo-ligase [Pseudomonadota bacterium]
MSAVNEKNSLRAELGPGPFGNILQKSGKAAEALRRLPIYRQAKQVFVGPDDVLTQVRINALLDGKELIMPAPGLKEGFFLLKPYSIPFMKLGHAVTYKGLADFGQRLSQEEIAGLQVGLLVAGAVAVDREGGRLGDGLGFFDLSCAIFTENNALALNVYLCALVDEGQVVAQVPQDEWDVKLNVIITGEQVIELSAESFTGAKIIWDKLPPKRIRKITPLWNLSDHFGHEE